jgi:hypothetical protein
MMDSRITSIASIGRRFAGRITQVRPMDEKISCGLVWLCLSSRYHGAAGVLLSAISAIAERAPS